MKSLPLLRIVCIAAVLSVTTSGLPAPSASDVEDVKSPKAEVSVSGRIKYPGRYRVTAESTLADVLKSAGGLTSEATGDVMVARRSEDGSLKRIELDAAKDGSFRLAVGDIIFVGPSK